MATSLSSHFSTPLSLQDFSMDPDIHRMHLAAHHMVRHLTAGMAMITCREALLVSISNNLKTAFIASVRVGIHIHVCRCTYHCLEASFRETLNEILKVCFPWIMYLTVQIMTTYMIHFTQKQENCTCLSSGKSAKEFFCRSLLCSILLSLLSISLSIFLFFHFQTPAEELKALIDQAAHQVSCMGHLFIHNSTV